MGVLGWVLLCFCGRTTDLISNGQLMFYSQLAAFLPSWQDPHNAVLDSPPIVEELALDPVLSGCKLIAASANDALLPRNGERGFPHYGVLLEWNNHFGSDILGLLRDNRGKCSRIQLGLRASWSIAL